MLPQRAALLHALRDPAIDLMALEAEKIRGAIRTDFILSIEILVIALGMVHSSALWVQIGVLSSVAVAMTIGVYGLVACIVKFDDLGLMLHRRQGDGRWVRNQREVGRFILKAAPQLMKLLIVVGTLAMFVVGGGILVHGMPPLMHAVAGLSSHAGTLLAPLLALALEMAAGWLAGAIAFGVVELLAKLRLRA